MAADHPLRRWKPFLAAFGVIDDAIEASSSGFNISRDEFRRARCAIVERLCDTPDKDESEEMYRGLDRAMVQSLLTLQVHPVAPSTLAKTELVPAVRALRKHECECVRALARDIIRGWRAAAEGDLVEVRAIADMLTQIVLPAEKTLPPPRDAAGDEQEQEAAGDGEAERAEAVSRHERAEKKGEVRELGHGEALL